MSKNAGKNISKCLSGKYSQKNLDQFQKEQFKKQQRLLVIWLVAKSLIELQSHKNFTT